MAHVERAFGKALALRPYSQRKRPMWKKKALAFLTAAAMAGSAIQPVMAQNYGRDYGNG